VDISARIAELGRQPFTARRFFLRHADRILFGSDNGPNIDYYRIFFRFLETEDEYFPYDPGDTPGQGRWNIYGMNLPKDVLEKVYYRNAMRALGMESLPG
jgi:predicted TIM-barrel fold metal-dependent hydrolase